MSGTARWRPQHQEKRASKFVFSNFKQQPTNSSTCRQCSHSNIVVTRNKNRTMWTGSYFNTNRTHWTRLKNALFANPGDWVHFIKSAHNSISFNEIQEQMASHFELVTWIEVSGNTKVFPIFFCTVGQLHQGVACPALSSVAIGAKTVYEVLILAHKTFTSVLARDTYLVLSPP